MACRSPWGPISAPGPAAAVASCTTRLATRGSSAPPRAPRKSVSGLRGVATSSRRSSQAAMALAAGAPIGTARSLAPLPITRTVRCSASTSRILMLVSSEMRSPLEYRSSTMARSRAASGSSLSIRRVVALAMTSSISPCDSTFGSRRERFGATSLSAGSPSMNPSLAAQAKKPRTHATRRWIDEAAVPSSAMSANQVLSVVNVTARGSSVWAASRRRSAP